MRRTLLRAVLAGAALATSLAILGAQDRPKIKAAPVTDTDATSGTAMFREYCAACHGANGKGDGPAAAALKKPVPDLTLLARKNHGEFPSFHVSTIIQGDGEIVAHGSKDMPLWGDLFRSLKRDDSVVALRVHNLTEYISGIQAK